ncbi:hypothetical protein JCM5350_003669 [Sporobolomyces pararoseus]
MTDQLNRSNTTTTFSSFFCTPNRKPSLRQLRPTPPPNYQHIDDVNNLSSSNDDPPSSLMKLSYPRSNSNRAIDLRASKLGMVEKMSSRERIERWNDVSISSQETEELTPLERWRMEVAREVAREKRKEEIVAQQRQKEEEEEQRKARESLDAKGTRVTSWKPSVLTTSSMRSAAFELQNQFESSSPFARSFAIGTLKTPETANSAPTSSVVRESFLNEQRQPHEDQHPYSHTFGFDETTGTLVTAAPLAWNSSAEETLLVPLAPETSASVSPIDPVFASDSYQFPLSQQRHPLPKIDTSKTPVTSTFSNSPVSAPVVSTYQSFVPPPRSSSLPFNDLQSVQTSSPSPPSTSVPPPLPPKDAPRQPDPSFNLLPPKAAALLGLIPTSHAPLATPRPPKPHFARDRQGSFTSSASHSGSPSVSTEQYRSSFYTNYDGPSRPSVDSSTPTTMTSHSNFQPHHRANQSSSSRSQGIVNRHHRPPPLTFYHRKEGMSSLPDLQGESPSTSLQDSSGYSSVGQRQGGGSSVSSSLDLSLRGGGRSSLETPRTLIFQQQPLPANSTGLYQTLSRAQTRAESEIESLLDAPLHEPLPSPPFPLTSNSTSRFGQSIGQDLSRNGRKPNSGSGVGTLRARASGSNLARSISQKGRGLARKLSLRSIAKPPITTERSNAGGIVIGQSLEEGERTEGKRGQIVQGKRSLKDLKKGLDQKLENSFRYW